MSERRIEELEIRLAYLERSLTELDEAVLGQAGRIDALEAVLRRLTERLERLANPEEEPPPEAERPPHY